MVTSLQSSLRVTRSGGPTAYTALGIEAHFSISRNGRTGSQVTPADEAVAAYDGSGTCPTRGEPTSIYDHRERRFSVVFLGRQIEPNSRLCHDGRARSSCRCVA